MAKSKNVRPVDAIYLHMETPDNLMFVTGVLLFDAPLELDAFKQVIEQRFGQFGRFQQKLKPTWWAFSDWRWVDDRSYHIDNHIFEQTLAAPGDQATLEVAISKLASQSLTMTQPLWQIDMMQGFDGGCAVVVRVHHSIADGIALIYVLLSILDSAETLTQPGGNRKSAWQRIKRTLGQIMVMAKVPSTMRQTLKAPVDRDTVLRGEIGNAKRVAWMDELPLAAVKAISKRHGATINDVLLTLLAGAIRSYLAARGEAVDEFEIHVVVPIGMRKLEKSAELGNVIGAVSLALPINIADPLERLRITKKRMDVLKRSPEAWVSYRASKLIGIMPRKRARNFITNARKKTSMLVSNVPGPRQQLTLLGLPVRRFVFYGPMTGRLAISVSILSYNGGVTVGTFADANVIDAPHELLAAFHDEYEAFSKLA